ncbi:MAG: hypothetical protein N2235_08465, partial [Fischerella sp.]|nr:hypothetical protein [Fischerella sp.]
MNIEIASMLVPIIIFSLFLMTGSLFLLVKHDKSFTKLILVPSALAFAVVIILFFANLLGRAVPLPLPDKFMYLAHRVVVE